MEKLFLINNVVFHDALSNAQSHYQDKNVNVSSKENVNVIDKDYKSITKSSNIVKNNELFNLDAKFHARDIKIRSQNSKKIQLSISIDNSN